MPDDAPPAARRWSGPTDEAMRYCPNVVLPRPGARGHRPFRLPRRDGHPGAGLRAGAPAARRQADRGRGRPVRLTRRSSWSSSSASRSSPPSSWSRAIAASKQQPLSLLLFGLGIRHVGKTVAQLLARRFGSMDGADGGAAAEAIDDVPGVGPTIAEAVAGFFAEPRNRDWSSGCGRPDSRSPRPRAARRDGPLAGKTYVLTGTLPDALPRRGHRADRAGRRTGGRSVSKKTDAVVAGDDAGSKLEKAKDTRRRGHRRGRAVAQVGASRRRLSAIGYVIASNPSHQAHDDTAPSPPAVSALVSRRALQQLARQPRAGYGAAGGGLPPGGRLRGR